MTYNREPFRAELDPDPAMTRRLHKIDRELRTLSRGLEPRETARRILELLNERDRLLGAWTRTCRQCGELFNASRADARYCSAGCKQSAYRNRALRMRVTTSDSIRPVRGVSASSGQSAGQRRPRPHRARRRQHEGEWRRGGPTRADRQRLRAELGEAEVNRG